MCARSSQSCTLHYNMVQRFPTDEGNGMEQRTWMDEEIVQLYKNKHNTPTWTCNIAVPTHGHTHHVCTRLTGVSPKINVMHGGTTMRKSIYSYYTVYLVHFCHFLNKCTSYIIRSIKEKSLYWYCWAHLALGQRSGAAFGGGGTDGVLGDDLLLLHMVGGKGLGCDSRRACVCRSGQPTTQCTSDLYWGGSGQRPCGTGERRWVVE